MWIVLVSFFLLYSILCNRLDSHLPSASKNTRPNPCNTPLVFDCVLPMFQTPQSKSFFSVPRIKELVMLHHGLWWQTEKKTLTPRAENATTKHPEECMYSSKKATLSHKGSFPQRSDRKQRRDGERKGSSHILFPQMEENNENEQKSRIPWRKPTWKNGRLSVCLSAGHFAKQGWSPALHFIHLSNYIRLFIE